jgi:hypothetical protein
MADNGMAQPAVYKAIAAVQGELAKTGIAKEGVNSSQNYKFRGIDQVYGALSPLLAKHGLCVIPRVIDREMHERVTVKEWNGQKKESVLFYVTVHAEFDFVSAEDGSKHTAATYGEAMDSGDKATNKAMSAAYKYAAFMTFAIPTEGDNDADASTHEVRPRADVGQSNGTVSQHPPANDTKRAEKWEGAYSGKSALHKGLIAVERNIRGCGDSDQLEAYLATDEYKDFVKSCERYNPVYLTGGDPAPPEFVGINDLVAKMRTDFANIASLGGDSIPDFIHEQAANVAAG